jgi:hypothetical protein
MFPQGCRFVCKYKRTLECFLFINVYKHSFDVFTELCFYLFMFALMRIYVSLCVPIGTFVRVLFVCFHSRVLA